MANWVEWTKIDTTTLRAWRLASRTSDTCPSWSAPMVGTSAIVVFLARKPLSARRNAGIVRAIAGLEGIGARFSRGRKGSGDWLCGGQANLPRTKPCRQAGQGSDSQADMT